MCNVNFKLDKPLLYYFRYVLIFYLLAKIKMLLKYKQMIYLVLYIIYIR